MQRRFRELADLDKARPMQRYMKTDMPFYGIQKPPRKQIIRELRRQFPITSRKQYREVITALWKLPHREEKYLAIQLAIDRADDFNALSLLPMWKRMISQGAWWDFVDDLAIRLVGPLVLEHRAPMTTTLDQWIDDRHLWIRRSALIAPIKHKDRTNQEQLFDHCARRMHETEFFIRKAIGWTLREYAYTDPVAVKRFALQYKDALSTLSFREATKHLDV